MCKVLALKALSRDKISTIASFETLLSKWNFYGALKVLKLKEICIEKGFSSLLRESYESFKVIEP